MTARLLAPVAAVALAAAVLGACRGPAEAPPAQRAVAAAHAAAGANLLLITIDTWRADSPGFAGGRAATPVLDRLAQQGRVFEQAHAHNVLTLPSHANILTGQYPFQHGVRENSGFELAAGVPTLATVLAAAGYATGAFVGAFPLDAQFGLQHGFAVYDDKFPKGYHAREVEVPERRGDQVVAPALAWWRQHDGEKRFLWVHLYDPHAPYTPPEPFLSRYAAAPYLGEVAATDSFLAPLLGGFEGGSEAPTVIVVTGDHGEALGDHGEKTHGLFAYESTLHVPLVLWGPGVEPGRDPRPVGHVDILPTVLDLLGVEAPPQIAGSSLVGAALPERTLYFESLSAFFNRGWAPLYGSLRGHSKYIHLPLPELYDLAADPREADNRVDAERRLARDLRAAIPAAAMDPADRGAVSDEVAAKLRSLGYLSAAGGRKKSYGPEDDPKTLIGIDTQTQELTALYSEGRLEEAAKLGREIVAARPDMALGYERLVTVLRDQGHLDEAVQVLQAAVRRGVTHPTLLRQLGLTLSEAGRGEEAVRVLEPLAGERDLDILNALGVAYYWAGRLDQAESTLGRVLARDADNAKALESLGAVKLSAGRTEEARGVLERALESDPSMAVAWNSLGVARQFLGDTPGALDAWRRAVELDPGQFDALYNLGLTAAAAGRSDVARAALRQYVATAPSSRFAEELRKARQVLARLPT